MSLYIVFRVTLIVFIIAFFNLLLMLFLRLGVGALFNEVLPSSYFNKVIEYRVHKVIEVIIKILATICLLCLIVLSELGILYLTNILSKFF